MTSASKLEVGQTKRADRAAIMKDVTTRLNSYRECIRHLWNMHFLAAATHASDKWAVRDEFDDACQMLFASLVVEPVGLAAASEAQHMLSPSRSSVPRVLRWLHVVPRETPIGVPIMINRDPRQSDGYWDYPIARIVPADVNLRFVRWFDFDELAFRDFRYYLVRVESAADGDIVGRAALIECEYCVVFLDESAFSGDSLAVR
jgi:hypothetical protein